MANNDETLTPVRNVFPESPLAKKLDADEKKAETTPDSSAERITLKDIDKALSDWYWCFKSWALAHYTLGITSTICAILIASNIQLPFSKDYLIVYVAIATAIITFLKAQPKTNAYITAWRNLRAERMGYYAGSSSLDKMVQTYKSGEDLIGKND